MDRLNDLNDKNIIKNRLAPLFSEAGLQLVILFGSIASGRTHQKSDIDLAFLFDEPADILSLTNRVIRLLHADRVDVIDLKHAHPLLMASVVRESILLYEKAPGLFNSYYSYAVRRYIDTKKLRDGQSKAVGYFLEERGIS